MVAAAFVHGCDTFYAARYIPEAKIVSGKVA